MNALELVGKEIGQVKLAVSGAGAAAIACLDLMVKLGVRRENIYVCDSKGLIYEGRAGGLDASKARYAQKDTGERTLGDVIKNADVFLGCSTANVLTQDMVKAMGSQPIILALANPDPEIKPELAKAVRPDCIIATGRSDYPNQVNNVLCFPYIFRGALDCGATRITEEMKVACVYEIAALAKMEISDEVANAYVGQDLRFGSDYVIPKPFDPRLILRIAPAVAKAAAESGVATRPIENLEAYAESLSSFVTHTSMFMRPVFGTARAVAPTAKRVIYTEGEDERVLRAAQQALDDQVAQPILVGRPEVIRERVKALGLHLPVETGEVPIVNPDDDPRFRTYWETYLKCMTRYGVDAEAAKLAVRRSNTVIGALAVKLGDADAMICGVLGSYDKHLDTVRNIIGVQPGKLFAALNAVILEDRTLFIADTYVNDNPSAEELAEIAVMAAREVQRFGLTPRVAFTSHSNFGSSKRPSAIKMRQAQELFCRMAPEIESEGEIQGDHALDNAMRNKRMPNNGLTESANVLICPNLDAANILYNVLKTTGGHGLTIGPMLMGANASVHVLTPSATMRRILNQTALAVAAAQHFRNA